MKWLLAVVAATGALLAGCAAQETQAANVEGAAPAAANETKRIPDMSEEAPNVQCPVVKSDEEWQAELTPEQYRVARKKGTEPAFTGKYWNSKKDGTYVCVCCGEPLFTSETKFNSGTGWPSFFQPVSDDAVKKVEDKSLGMERTEVVCSNCGAHLGHVFPDGPKPTGLRYCINSASLELEPEKGAAAKDEKAGADE